MNSQLPPRIHRALLFALAIGVAQPAPGAEPAAPAEGLREVAPRVHALVGGRVHLTPTEVVENATIVIRDGVVVAAGAGIATPAEARVWDLQGRTVYAGFIESDSSLFLPAAWKPAGALRRASDEEAPAPPAPPPTAAAPAASEAATGTRSWNSRVTPERAAHRALVADDRGAEALRRLGFALAHVIPARGVFRGQSAVVSLGRGDFNGQVVRETMAQGLAFEHGGFGPIASYPASLMGATALLRQTLWDARWYGDAQAHHRQAGGTRPEVNEALATLGPVVRGEQPVFFELGSELDLARAAQVVGEFKLKAIFRGSGYEYRVLRDWPKGVPVVVPLAFPEPPEVEDPDRALDLTLDRLEHWELAPGNAARLAQAGAPVALTTAGLRRPETEFWSRVRTAVQRGLPPATALAALTTTPADFLGLARSHGSIAPGKAANLTIASGDLFRSDDAEIQLVWIDGEPFELEAWRRKEVRGAWRVAWTGAPGKSPAEIKITGRSSRLRASADGVEASARTDGTVLTLLAPPKWFGLERGTTRLTAQVEGAVLVGTGDLPDGRVIRWRAERTAAGEPPRTPEKKPETLVASGNRYPAGAFGRAGPPEQPKVLLVRNATVWTSGPAGVLENADVLVDAGKIARVGRGLTAPADAVIVDASGRHVSPGLIDCHSHVAIDRGVNEGTHSVTVEVRVGDVLDPTDIGLYRQLAGGLTTANLLHGSANAMGGQNQVIKLRWGESAEGLKFAGAPPGVKFALGENVTRKSATTLPTRYPVSRMGVREIMLDAFSRARDYEREWTEFRAGRTSRPPRRDLRMEAALEILRGERLIHIHSYRQDEVLAFIRLAQDLKLPVATFQHILEGYKVAREIAALGAGGSCFSDWWAYKFEVVDAIPYAGALMHEAGVIVSFNSDDRELARHLNTEAAKAVKYGGVSPVEALKFVTINPARQLRLEARVGSLEAGKDADFVIWSAPPLSGYAHVEQAWIDGRRYFDRKDDAQMRTAAAQERAALIQKILPERQRVLGAGGPGGGEGGGRGEDRPGAPTVWQVLQQLAAAHDGSTRGLYHDGSDAHNCTTHDQP
ncbi:MAG: amidohydrolase family protein [Verrucomicrobia bacterium]|nr:amidohydrolase family protein [Verrucomicrobiota bacterium]